MNGNIKRPLYIFGSAIVIFALLVGFLWAKRGRESDYEEKLYVTRVRLDRLLTDTQRLFPGKHGVSEREFWTRLGQPDPLLDGWGNPFRLSGQDNLIWESAGPDGVFGTRDDIFQPVWAPKSNSRVADPILHPDALRDNVN